MEKSSVEKKKSKAPIIAIILLAIITIGLSIYVIFLKSEQVNKESNTPKENQTEGTGSKNEESSKEKTLSLNDEKVKQLYRYLTDKEGKHISKYVLSENRDISSFSNKEKYEYGFNQLSQEQVKVTGMSDEGLTTFTIEKNIYDVAIKKVFGENINYGTGDEYEFVTPFAINGGTLATFHYNSTNNTYEGVSSGVGTERIIEPYYTKLKSAVQKDNTIILTEKAIFTDFGVVTSNKDSYSIFKDSDMKHFIFETKKVIMEGPVNSPVLTEAEISSLLEKGSTVTHTFKKDACGQYHYSSSFVEI